jgi:hypothetical protein
MLSVLSFAVDVERPRLEKRAGIRGEPLPPRTGPSWAGGQTRQIRPQCQNRGVAVQVQQSRVFDTTIRYHVSGRDSTRLGHGHVLLVAATTSPPLPVALRALAPRASACATTSALRTGHLKQTHHVGSSAGQLA